MISLATQVANLILSGDVSLARAEAQGHRPWTPSEVRVIRHACETCRFRYGNGPDWRSFCP